MEDPAEEAKRLFMHNTVKDSLDYLYSLSRTIDESSHSLRSLIGDSEKDLLAACERISDMQMSSAAILSVQERLQQNVVPSRELTASAEAETTKKDTSARHQRVRLLSEVVTPSESVVSALRETEAVLQSQLVNVEALLLSGRVIAACGALKEVQTLLVALRGVPAEVRASLMTSTVVAAAEEGQHGPMSPGARASPLMSAYRSSSGVLTSTSDAPTTTPNTIGADDPASLDGRPQTTDLCRWAARRQAVLASCTRTEDAVSVFENQSSQYERELLQAIRTALRRTASEAALETLTFLQTHAARGRAGNDDLTALDDVLAGLETNPSSHTPGTGNSGVASRRQREEEANQHYRGQQQRRLSAMVQLLQSLFAAVDGVTWSESTRRWLSSTAARTAMSSAMNSPLRQKTTPGGSPLTSAFASPNASPVFAGTAPSFLESTQAAVNALTSLRAGKSAVDGDAEDTVDHARAVITRLAESTVMEAAAVCARWGMQQLSETCTVLAEPLATCTASDTAVAVASPSLSSSSSAPSSVARWASTRAAQQQSLLHALHLPPSLIKALSNTPPPTTADAAPAPTSSSSSASSLSPSLSAVGLFLVAQAKFMYASLCESVSSLPPPSDKTAIGPRTRTRTTNMALLLSVEEEDEMDSAYDMERTSTAAAEASSLTSIKRELWRQMSEGVHHQRVTSASAASATSPAARASQTALATLLEAKNALLYARTSTRSGRRTRGLSSTTSRKKGLARDHDGDGSDNQGMTEGDDDDNKYDDDDDDEEAGVALPLVRASAQAARRRHYVDFLLHATAAVSGCELIRYRSVLTAASSLSASSGATLEESRFTMGGGPRSGYGVGTSLFAPAPARSAELLDAEAQHVLLTHDRTRLVESQANLLRPYARAVIALLGEGEPILWAAYLFHELDTPAAQTNPAASVALFDANAWQTSMVTVLSTTLQEALAHAFTCLLHLQQLSTSQLLDAATRAAATLQASTPGPLLPRCHQLLNVLAVVAGTRTSTTSHGETVPPAASSHTTSRHADLHTDSTRAPQLMREALRQAQHEAAAASGRADDRLTGSAAGSSSAGTLLARLSLYQTHTTFVDTTSTSPTSPPRMAAPPLPYGYLFTSVGAALAALLTTPPTGAPPPTTADGSDPSLALAATSTTPIAPHRLPDEGSPSPVPPRSTIPTLHNQEEAMKTTTVEAEALQHVQSTLLTFLFGLPSSVPDPTAANTTATVRMGGMARAQLPAPHVVLRAWSASLARCVLIPARLSVWLQTRASTAMSVPATTTATASASVRALLTNLAAQQQTWLTEAMRALRTAVQAESEAARQDVQASNGGQKNRVGDAARAFELSSVALVLCDAADRLAQLSTALSTAGPSASSSPLLPSLSSLRSGYLSCCTEAQQLFRTLHEPWRALLREEARDALKEAYVNTALQAFVAAFAVWAPSPTLASSTPSAEPSLTSSVWLEGFRTAHGQHWREDVTSDGLALAYPFLPSITLEKLSWTLEQIMHELRQHAPSTVLRLRRHTTRLSAASAGASRACEEDVLARARHEVAEAMAVVVDAAVLPGLRALPDTITAARDATRAHQKTKSLTTNNNNTTHHAHSASVTLHGAPSTAAASSAVAELPRATLERLVKTMTNDFWLQLYLDLGVWRLVWLTAPSSSPSTSTPSSSEVSSTLSDRFEALLRHCTLHGEAARWTRVRPLLDEAVRVWLASCGTLHGHPSGRLTVAAAPTSPSSAASTAADKLGPLRKVERFSLLPISFSSASAASLAGPPRGARGGGDGGVGSGALARDALLGTTVPLRTGAHRLASADLGATTHTRGVGSAGSGGGGVYGQRFYAPPPPSASSSASRPLTNHSAGGGAPGRALFVDAAGPGLGGGVELSGGGTSAQDGATAAAALWGQTQRGWNMLWGGGGAQPPHPHAGDSSQQTL